MIAPFQGKCTRCGHDHGNGLPDEWPGLGVLSDSPDPIHYTVESLAEITGVTKQIVILELMKYGVMATSGSQVDVNAAKLVIEALTEKRATPRKEETVHQLSYRTGVSIDVIVSFLRSEGVAAYPASNVPADLVEKIVSSFRPKYGGTTRKATYLLEDGHAAAAQRIVARGGKLSDADQADGQLIFTAEVAEDGLTFKDGASSLAKNTLRRISEALNERLIFTYRDKDGVRMIATYMCDRQRSMTFKEIVLYHMFNILPRKI